MNKSAELKERYEHAQQRSNIYGFLARMYRKELSAEMLARIKESYFTEILSELGVHLGEEFFSVSDDELIENLAVEYTRLFLGPGKHISPHESIHYERDDGDWGRLWGASTVEVKKFVESLGLKYKESDTSIPDHISVELELMQKVIEKERQAWIENNDKDALHYLKIEHMFMEDHLLKWIPGFCDKIISETEMSFYSEMARLTKSFIELEEKELNNLLSEVKKEVKQA
jgi:TorA maturation chaperone TorD